MKEDKPDITILDTEGKPVVTLKHVPSAPTAQESAIAYMESLTPERHAEVLAILKKLPKKEGSER